MPSSRCCEARRAPGWLPAVVREGLVGLRHAVDVVLALVGAALLRLRRAARGCYLFFTPYCERAFLRSETPAASSVPRTTLYLTPGRSLTRPPRTSTTECSCRLWPSPGM